LRADASTDVRALRDPQAVIKGGAIVVERG
jgi:hypothetical protein